MAMKQKMTAVSVFSFPFTKINKFLNSTGKHIYVWLYKQELVRIACSREENQKAPGRERKTHHLWQILLDFWILYILCVYYLVQKYDSPNLTYPLKVWHKHNLLYELLPSNQLEFIPSCVFHWAVVLCWKTWQLSKNIPMLSPLSDSRPTNWEPRRGGGQYECF